MTNEKTPLDKLIEYAETAMADGYPYEVIGEDLALTVKALRALRVEPTVRLSDRDSCPNCGFDVRDHEPGALARCGVSRQAEPSGGQCPLCFKHGDHHPQCPRASSANRGGDRG